ncbi:MAG: hypothetical protein JW809_03855 [Pirellulales bacterium]|nr:hypothetical protein [Pirellulales bacterium]
MIRTANLVEDGQSRLAQSDEYRALRRALRQAVAARFADALAEAGFLGRLALRWRIRREIRRELKKITPSKGSLWLLGQGETPHGAGTVKPDPATWRIPDPTPGRAVPRRMELDNGRLGESAPP